MSFGSPQYLIWLVLPVLVLLVLFLDFRSQSMALASIIPKKVWPRFFPDWQPSARWKKAKLFSAALGFAIIALAQPQWGYREEALRSSGLDVLLALDVSRSMDVEDVVPSRMKKTRHWIRTLLNELTGHRVGIVAFASSSFLACPLTTDLDYVLDTLEVLGPSSVVNQGTDIGIGLSTALAAIERGSELSAEENRDPKRKSRVILLISDGEDHEEAFLEAARKLKGANIQLVVVGVGTPEGGFIPVLDESGKVESLKKNGRDTVISRFNPDSLKKIADAGGARYWTMTDSESEVKEILRELGTLTQSQQKELKARVPIDRYQWPLVVSIGLFVWELALPLVVLANKKRKLLLALIFMGFVFPVFSSSAGESVQGYIKNRRGIDLFSDEEIDGAREKFKQAIHNSPDSLEPRFNLGVVELKKGNKAEAIRSFEQVSRDAAMEGNANLTAQSLYNLGSAYEQDQKLPDAIRSFATAAQMAEYAGDSELSKEARKRIQKIQDQMQSQAGKGSQSKQSNNQGEGSGAGQSSSPSSYEDPSISRRREFKSEKLSSEDSERVMAELSARERDLQAKLKKQRGARRVPHEKDW